MNKTLIEQIEEALYYNFDSPELVSETAKAIEVIVLNYLTSYGSYLYEGGKYAKPDAYDFEQMAKHWLNSLKSPLP